MACTQASAAWSDPLNWPLLPPESSLPIEPPGLVGGGEAPGGRLMPVFMDMSSSGLDELLLVLVLGLVLALVVVLVLAVFDVSSSLRGGRKSPAPTPTRTTTTARTIHGRALFFFGGCP